MKLRHLAAVALALFLPFVAASCGDDSTGDMSEGEISKQLQDAGVSEKEADCMAPKLKEADLTEDDLDKLEKSQDESSKAGKAFVAAITECMGIGTDAN
jgi:hypothetical protein